jgi:hypothetical protein
VVRRRLGFTTSTWWAINDSSIAGLDRVLAVSSRRAKLQAAVDPALMSVVIGLSLTDDHGSSHDAFPHR